VRRRGSRRLIRAGSAKK